MSKNFNEIFEIREPSAQSQEAGTSSMFSELQKASNFRTVKRSLRSGGIGSIVFGVIAMVVGFGGMDDNPVNAILGIIGVLLFVEGIWLVSDPKPAGMIVDGIALMILGIWNIIITVANSASGGGTSFFALLGVWQIIWGVQSFGRFNHFSKLPMQKPSDSLSKQIDTLINEISKSKTKDRTDLIEFQAKGISAQGLWKGKLEQNSAVFVQGAGQDLIFSEKNRVIIDTKGQPQTGKTVKAYFQIGDRTMNGTLSAENYERYQTWKNRS
jgi:hypothetical protein